MAVPAAADTLPEAIDPAAMFLPETSLTVFVDDQADNALSGNYPQEEIVTLTAPDVSGKTFRHWTNAEGTVLSYAKDLKIKMYAHTQLNAVYGASAQTAKATAAKATAKAPANPATTKATITATQPLSARSNTRAQWITNRQ